MKHTIPKEDKQVAVEKFGMRGMTISSLKSMVRDHADQKSYISAVITQAAKEEIFVKRAMGAQ